MAGDAGVTLYTAGTPNGWKAAILLEELGVPYNVHALKLSKQEQKQDWYLKINPNGRIPAIVDHNNGDYALFESGALMMYLCDHYGDGSLFPRDDDKARHDVIAWLMFQMGGLGPMQGQANHFMRYAPVTVEYGQQRYVNETKRLYSVLDKQLEGKEWLAAGRYTIADIACYAWVFIHYWSGIESLDDFPNLKAWKARIDERPAVQKGLDIPEPTRFKEAMTNPEVKQQMIDAIKGSITPTSYAK